MSKQNVRVYLKGRVFWAPLGTPLPTDVDTPLDGAFIDLGILTDDGVTDDLGRGVKNILALGGKNVRTFVETEEPTVKVIALEENAIVQELINPGGVPVTTGDVTVTTRAGWTPNPGQFVFENKDGLVTWRYAPPSAEIVDVGPRVLKAAAATRELTVVIYPDDDGDYGVDITNDPAMAATGS